MPLLTEDLRSPAEALPRHSQGVVARRRILAVDPHRSPAAAARHKACVEAVDARVPKSGFPWPEHACTRPVCRADIGIGPCP